MFIFDFVAETVLDQIIDWLYGKIVGFLNDFFAMMNNMGVELFDLPWVNAITTFFGWLGWALFVVGLVVGAFRRSGKGVPQQQGGILPQPPECAEYEKTGLE